jgi:hypothetical protein
MLDSGDPIIETNMLQDHHLNVSYDIRKDINEMFI